MVVADGDDQLAEALQFQWPGQAMVMRMPPGPPPGSQVIRNRVVSSECRRSTSNRAVTAAASADFSAASADLSATFAERRE